MEKILKKEILINSFDVDLNNRLRLDQLFRYMQQMAYEHSEKLNFGYEYLLDKNIIWVLSRILIQMERYPIWNEKIVIKTWPRKLKRLFAVRDFIIYDLDNNIIGKATSYWLMLDIKKNRPVRIGKKFVDFKYLDKKIGLDKDLKKIKKSGELKKVYSGQVNYTDLDQNKHVNNARYIEWILNSFNIDYFNNYRIKNLQANFLKEMNINTNYVIQKSSACKLDKTLIVKNLDTDEKSFASQVKFRNNP